MTEQNNHTTENYNRNIGDADLTVTPSARAKIAGLVSDTNGEAAAVRIYVSGGGCSGMNYGMTFAEKPESRDSILGSDTTGNNMNGNSNDGALTGFKLVVDPVALSFLCGAEIDYVYDGVNASFVFNNVFQAVGGSGSCGGCGGAV